MNTKNNNWLKTLAAALTLGIASGNADLRAQDEDETVYTLSPFTVDESETVGYAATSTLAGTRIKTDLKDLGASISVVTEAFMDDVAATDAQTLLSYLGNVEVGGFQGNFTGASASTWSRFYQLDARTNPQRNQRVRGLFAADLTRNLYLTDIPFDSYNTGRVTVSRGPNSLLFGIGSPGGVIDNASKQAIHNSDFGELGIRLDNYGSWRAELDYNKSLVEDRVALRISILEESLEYKQKPAFEDQTRFYAALDIILFESGSAVTRLKINGEDGEQNGSPVEVIPPTVSYHNWFEPIPTSISQFTGSQPTPWVVDPSEGGTWEFQALHDDPIGTEARENLIHTNVHPTVFRQPTLVYSTRGATDASVGGVGNIAGYNGVIPWSKSRDTLASTGLAGTPVAAGLPDDTPVGNFRDFHTNTPYSEGYAIGFAAPTLQNRDVFDFYNQVYSNGHDRIEREFDAVNFALEQTFLDGKLGIEIAYDEQSYSTHQDFLFAGGQGGSTGGPYDIYVSNSVYLMNGQLNPNLGRAYTRVRKPRQRDDITDRETFRITATAEADFRENDGWLKHLGLHRFTGLFNDYTLDTFNHTTGDAVDSDQFNITSAQAEDNLNGGGRRSLNILAFTSDSLIGVQSLDDVRLHPIDFRRPEDGYRYNYAWVDTTAAGSLNGGVAGDRMIHTNEVFVRRIIESEDIGQTNIESKAFAWQSYFLDDHIVGLYGYREDDTESFAINTEAEAGIDRLVSSPAEFGPAPNIQYNPAFTKLSSTPALVESGDTQTWSVVARIPEFLLGDLPFNLQAHWSTSENFNPIGLRNSVLGEPIGQPTGSTEEYGFLISTDDQKYSIKFNWFTTELAAIDSGVNFNLVGEVVGRINSFRRGELIGQFPWSMQLAALPGGASPEGHPIQSYDAYYTAMLNTVPQVLQDIVNPRQEDTTGDGVWDEYDFDPIPNIRSTRDQLAEGFEVEFVANPTPSWRILANISQQETIFTNTAPVMAQVVEDYVGTIQAGRLDELQEDGSFTRPSRTYELELLAQILAPVRVAKALENQVANEQREWRITGVSTYQFQEGTLAGFGIGGAVRWEDEAATGYVFSLDPETNVPIPDVNRPFFDDGLFSGDLWLTYRRKIWDEKIDWSVRLNIRNLVGESGNIPVKTNPDGQVAVIRIPPPRTIYLSNSFKF
ncbi:MAG: hypothetical protein O7C75_08060 [Verrucomicrobia bacterium]|nr:hypothetical protein [Verrucomicrobiota bacterium]